MVIFIFTKYLFFQAPGNSVKNKFNNHFRKQG